VKLTVDRLLPYLTAHPDLCEHWLRWSADKRVTSGWYFTRDGADFVVGFYPPGEVLNFHDPTVACAEYVVREVKAIGTCA
jgi:hypothetical protein